jgi:hypothetical protein
VARCTSPRSSLFAVAPGGARLFDRLPAALGLTTPPRVGDPVRVAPEGLPPIDGVVDFANPDAIGVRTDDALYRFVEGIGPTVAVHHLFADGVDGATSEQAWRAWLAGLAD